MLQERQVDAGDSPEIVVRSMVLRFRDGACIEDHAHSWGQLIYATTGVMTVRTNEEVWVAPSRRAIWAPAGVSHSIEMSGRVEMRTVYLHDRLAERAPRERRVIAVSPLLRELIVRVTKLGMLRSTVATEMRLASVLADELVETGAAPLELRMPVDPRARRVAERVCESPGDALDLEALALGSGASVRTIERAFRREVGTTFGRWRQQVRLLEALRRLAAGEPVGAVAMDVGYESTSAFIAMFKKALGTTPRRYYDDAD
ncbi:MAG: helix-turn-helix transcriptional regulator [Planctomycetota bacterium]|nr:helix-turn-helix transcriptional regulator [Planctomycetota bacterium]